MIMEAHQEYILIRAMSTWTTEVGRVLLRTVLCYNGYNISDLEW